MCKVTWEQALVASLRESKDRGYSFAAGWAMAVRSHPPRSAVEKEIVGAVEMFCFDAWHELKPALRSFSLEMLREGDRSRPAGRPGQHRALDAMAA